MKSVYDLISLANKLDKLGLIREADLLDHTIKVASSFSDTLEAEINRVDKKETRSEPLVRNIDEETLVNAKDLNSMISDLYSQILVAEEANDTESVNALNRELQVLLQLHQDLLHI